MGKEGVNYAFVKQYKLNREGGSRERKEKKKK